jgi:hypothetical protein
MEDTMELTDPALAVARRHLDAARAALRDLGSGSIADSAIVVARTLVHSAVHVAMNELDGLDRALAPDEPGIQPIACPFCANRIMPAATLCGFCWRDLTSQNKA